MVIANPIYDVVFKRLMEDQRVAKFFIETVLDEDVLDVEVQPQEFTYADGPAGLAVFRLDFIATIRTAGQGFKKVLIEIQKARQPIDLMRFRNYLGEQYRKEETVPTDTGRRAAALPIVTIYLLGFTLPEIEAAALKVNRQYLDLLTQEVIPAKSDFIERLTHDCYVVQLPRIVGKARTRLEQLLSVFEQRYFVDDHRTVKEYSLPIADERIGEMVAILRHVGLDPAGRQSIEDEREAQRVYALWFGEQNERLARELAASQAEQARQATEMQRQAAKMQRQAEEIAALRQRLGEQ